MELIAAIIIIGCVSIFVLSILGMVYILRDFLARKKWKKRVNRQLDTIEEKERQPDMIGYF